VREYLRKNFSVQNYHRNENYTFCVWKEHHLFTDPNMVVSWYSGEMSVTSLVGWLVVGWSCVSVMIKRCILDVWLRACNYRSMHIHSELYVCRSLQ